MTTPARYRLDDDVDARHGDLLIEQDTTTGYEFIRERGHGKAAHHRILAVAWGLIDGLDDPREVDHAVPCRTLNVESNLQAIDVVEHGRITREREQARQARAAGDQRLDAYTDGGSR